MPTHRAEAAKPAATSRWNSRHSPRALHLFHLLLKLSKPQEQLLLRGGSLAAREWAVAPLSKMVPMGRNRA